MPEINVQDEQGNTHVFPDGSTPEMIAKALGVSPPAPPTPQPVEQEPPPPSHGLQNFLGDLGSLAKGAIGTSVGLTPGMDLIPHQIRQALGIRTPLDIAKGGVQQAKQAPAEFQQRKQAGYNLPYRLAAPVAEMTGANVPGMEQSAQQGDVGGVLGHALAVPAAMGVAEGVGRGLPFLKNMLPNKASAGANFQTVMGAAKDVPVDTTASGNTALQIKDFATRGGRQPKVVTDFIRRATDPNQGPITYEEARDFASNASQLSAEERNALKPNVKRMIGQFARDLNSANADAANQAGVLPQYQSAMKEYRQASTLEDFQNMLKKSAVNTVKYAVPTAVGGVAAGYAAKKVLGVKK